MLANTVTRWRAIAITTALAAIAAMVAVSGCSDSGRLPTEASLEEQLWQDQFFLTDAPELVLAEMAEDAEVDALARPSGPRGRVLRILDAAEGLEDAEFMAGRNWLVRVATAYPDQDNEIVFGSVTRKLGLSSLFIPAGALSEATEIIIVMKVKGNRQIFLYPDGTQFAEGKEALLTISWEGTRYEGDGSDLSVFYHVPDWGWDTLPSTPDAEAHTVTASLEHFSRYAIGTDGRGTE